MPTDLSQISINVHDVVPPKNFATVDKGNIVGTVYTKEQTDNKISDAFISGIKGVANTSTVPSITGFERYIVHEVGIYTNFISGGSPIEVTTNDLDVVNGVANNRVILEVKEGVATKIVERVKGDKGEGLEFSADENLFSFTDLNNAVIGSVNKLGEFDIQLTEQTKERARLTDQSDDIISFKDVTGKVLATIDADGQFVGKIKEDIIPDNFPGLHFTGIELIYKKISLQSVAVGRASAEGIDDAPKVALDGDGYTHPKVLHIEKGFAGYKYWMAITPTFGLISAQPSPAYYENPHIFCSNDGVNFIEPVGISNPIDVTAPETFTDTPYPFWSDTHLLIGDDGYLYCYYRGVNMPKGYLTLGLTGNYPTVTVCRKTRDGINWGEREIVFEHPNSGSQAFLNYKSRVHCFDVVYDSVETPLPISNMPKYSAIFRRSSLYPDKDFNEYDTNQIIKFDNNYLPANQVIWHLEVEYFDGVFLMLINSGPIGGYIGNSLYLAYSYDGWNFKMIKTPVYFGSTYRSSLTPIKSENGVIELNLYRADTTNGHIELYKIYIKK